MKQKEEVLNNNQDPLITYFFVNKNLNMSGGKLGVQTARAGQVMLLNEIKKEDTLLLDSLNELFAGAKMEGNKSICLKANENQLSRLLLGDLYEKIQEISVNNDVPIRLYSVHDVGHTEVEPNSLTVVVMTPVPQSIIQPITKKFNLY